MRSVGTVPKGTRGKNFTEQREYVDQWEDTLIMSILGTLIPFHVKNSLWLLLSSPFEFQSSLIDSIKGKLRFLFITTLKEIADYKVAWNEIHIF